jgi:hypothetical protein
LLDNSPLEPSKQQATSYSHNLPIPALPCIYGSINAGADPCVVTCTNSTPLHSAAASNRLDCAELLLLVPAVLQQLDWVNEDGLTPAGLALKHGHKLMQGMLLQAAEAAAAGVPASSDAELASRLLADKPGGAPAATAVAGGASRSMQAALAQQQQQQQQQQPVLQGLRPGFLLSKAVQRQQILSSSEEEDDDASSGSCCSSPRSSSNGDAVLLPGEGGNSNLCGTQQAAAETEQLKLQQLQQQQQQLSTAAAGVSTGSSSQLQASEVSSSSNPAAGAAAAAVIDKQLGRSWLDAARAADLRLLQAMAAAQPQLLNYCGQGTSYALIGNSVSERACEI